MALRRQSLVCALACFCVVASGTVQAVAGAWTKKTGEGEVIVSGLYAEASESFGKSGDPSAIPVFRKADMQALAEYGLSDGVTVIGRAEWQSVSSGRAPMFDEGRFGLVGFGLRARLYESRGAVVSAEAVGRVALEREEGGETGDLDLRLAAGYGWSAGAYPAFVNAEAGFRRRFGDPADEIRVDLTVGVRPRPRLLLLAQTFNAVVAGDASGGAVEREHKLAVSAVYDVTSRLSVQVGGIATVAGARTPRERGLITAVWWRF
ncbi:MAG: hypothetical protein H7Y08_12120 [Rhizobiaceae bacterium]|nr:hypothetical protein [Rhizobiaceae bacterium]